MQAFPTRWLWAYNNERPNVALGGTTPKQKFAFDGTNLCYWSYKRGDVEAFPQIPYCMHEGVLLAMLCLWIVADSREAHSSVGWMTRNN
jgi:hypothetical protein